MRVNPVGQKVVYDVLGPDSLYSINNSRLSPLVSVAIASGHLAAAVFSNATDAAWTVLVFNPTTGQEIRTDTFSVPGFPGGARSWACRVDDDSIFFVVDTARNSSSATQSVIGMITTTQTTTVTTVSTTGLIFNYAHVYQGFAYVLFYGDELQPYQGMFYYLRVKVPDLTYELVNLPAMAPGNDIPFLNGYVFSNQTNVSTAFYPETTLTPRTVVNTTGLSGVFRLGYFKPDTDAFLFGYFGTSSDYGTQVVMKYDAVAGQFTLTPSTYREAKSTDIPDAYSYGSWHSNVHSDGLIASIDSIEDNNYSSSGLQAPYRWNIHASTDSEWGHIEVSYPNPFSPDLVNFNTYLDAMPCDMDVQGVQFVYGFIAASGSYDPTTNTNTEHRALVVGWGTIGGPDLDGLLNDKLKYFD